MTPRPLLRWRWSCPSPRPQAAAQSPEGHRCPQVYLGAPFLGAKESTRAAVGAPLSFLGT